MNLVDKYGHARCDDYISVNDESVIYMSNKNEIGKLNFTLSYETSRDF